MILQSSLNDLEKMAEGLTAAATGASTALQGLATEWKQAIDRAEQRASDLVGGQSELATFALGDGFEGELAAFGAATDTVRNKAEALPGQLEALQAQGQTLIESFSADHEEFANLLEERREALEGLLETQHEGVEHEFNELVVSVEERAGAVFDSIKESIEDVLVKKPDEAMQAVTEVLTDGIEGATDLAGDIASETMDETAERVTGLVDHVVDSAGKAVENAVEKLIDLLVEKIASEATEAIFETQAGANFTMAMQQYLPALIVANAVAPKVQQLLNAARMGT